MMQQIPKAARDLLARQVPADAHPSPDLLNGYIEQELAADEKTRVASHLAACAECREVVFLASAAGEEDLATVSRQERLIAATSRRAWLSWKWTVPAVAVLVIASGLVVERDRILTPGRPASQQTVMIEGQPAAPSETVTAPKTVASPPASNVDRMVKKSAAAPPIEQKPVAKALPSLMEDRAANQPLARKEAVPPPATTGASESLAAGSPTASQAQNERRRAPARAPSESAETSAAAPSASADATQSGAVSRAPGTDAMKAGFAKATGGNDIQLQISNIARALVDHSNWRITAAGHLERSTGPGTWTRVLASQSVVFHSLATVGTDVWAGGNNGALFHSADAGEHWNKVALTADGHRERAGIVSIHFDTAQQGTVHSDSGATWSTADGGQSWTKQ